MKNRSGRLPLERASIRARAVAASRRVFFGHGDVNRRQGAPGGDLPSRELVVRGFYRAKLRSLSLRGGFGHFTSPLT